MPPKKKLSKKEKARLEAEQAELQRIEMEKEKLKKLEEARQRKKLEMEQAKHRQQQEVAENRLRRSQLRDSMAFFDTVRKDIEAIKADERDECEWEKYMRCNGLPHASSPSDLRKYIHQWHVDIARRQLESRNWLLRTDERTLLTQDAQIEDLTRVSLRKQQGNLGDVYSQRIKEVLGILNELDETLMYKKTRSPHVNADLSKLKTEIRVFLKQHLDEFTYKTMSHIDRDMEIDRPGVSKHVYSSEVFKSFIWTFAKDAQIAINPKARIGEQSAHNEIDFPTIEMQISLPPTVQLQSSALRGLWLAYDHFSDYCNTFLLRHARAEGTTILKQTKREWRKRKEILQSMLDECAREIPLSELEQLTQDQHSTSSQPPRERTYDVDKLYAEYEDELSKARRRAIGPEAYGMLETDVNLRKYRIIGGVYCIDFLETPPQDKQLNARSFIRTISAPNSLCHKEYYQTYKPPPPVLPGVRRLPEEIEAEMRMIEAALDKLAFVTLQLPDSVIWFEPPVACRLETHIETIEMELADGVKPKSHSTTAAAGAPQPTATPTEATPLSTNPNPSPHKSSPRGPTTANNQNNRQQREQQRQHQRERTDLSNLSQSQKTDETLPMTLPLPLPLPMREIGDFDMGAIPSDVDLYGLVKDFVVPRLPHGFCVMLEQRLPQSSLHGGKPIRKVMFLARQQNIQIGNDAAIATTVTQLHLNGATSGSGGIGMGNDFVDLNEPAELFPPLCFEKLLKFRHQQQSSAPTTVQLSKPTRQREQQQQQQQLQQSSSSSSSSSSCNNSKQQTTGVSGVPLYTTGAVAKQRYLFSQLIEDLDRLWSLQLPREQQEEVMQQISEQLSPTSSIDHHHRQLEEEEGGLDNGDDVHVNNKALSQELTEVLQPATAAAAFAYYTGISFVRDSDIIDDRTIYSDDNDNVDDNSDDNSDEDEEDDDDSFADCLNENASGGGGGVGAGASGSLHELLSKHSHSEDTHVDGRNQQQQQQHLSNVAAITQVKWSTRDVHDTKFNEDKLSIQFRTGRMGIFGFALNKYSNMPYQTWDLRPDMKNPGTILFSFTASLISLDMTITENGYTVNNFQGGSTQGITEMIGKTMSLMELKATLILSAVDIFPDEDAFCYTEGSCEKNYIMEMHAYACISTLALSHNFSWSRWNLLAGSRTAVLLIRELLEGKKVPYYSTLLVTPLKTSIIDCTEVSASFNAVGIPGMEYYADLYQLSQAHAQPVSLEKQRLMNPVLRDNIARILMGIRPLSLC